MHTSLRPRAPRLATHRVSRLALRLLATVTAAIGVGAWGFAGSPVSAETELVSSSTANGEELLTQPTAITVVFNEAVPGPVCNTQNITTQRCFLAKLATAACLRRAA